MFLLYIEIHTSYFLELVYFVNFVHFVFSLKRDWCKRRPGKEMAVTLVLLQDAADAAVAAAATLEKAPRGTASQQRKSRIHTCMRTCIITPWHGSFSMFQIA